MIRTPHAYELNPVHALLQRVRKGYAPPPELTVSEYSDQRIVLTSGPQAGRRFQTSYAPYQCAILNGFHEPGVEVMVVMGSSQWGKTQIVVNICGFHIEHDPCAILVVEPTLDPMARDFARNRLEPVISASPTLEQTVSKRRSKDASNTTLAKTFRGGSITIAGANSASSLAARPVRLLLLDEIDRYPKELPGEGATLAIAMKRTQSFQRRKRIGLFSSPTLVEGPIHIWYKRGDQRRYCVPCPGCGHMHPYEWKNIHWNREPADDPSSAWLECPKCQHRIDDGTRVALLSKGEWRAENPERRDRHVISFHLWEAYSPMSSLSDIVASFLRARELQKQGDHAEMHTWQNTTLGEPIEIGMGEGLQGHQILSRIEAVEENVDVPAGACCITMGVDVQDDRLEALVWAWGPGEESWLIDRHTIPGDTSSADPWASLNQLLDHQYMHASGQRLSIQSTCIDSAGHRTNLVYEYAYRNAVRRVYAIIGRAGQRPIVSSPSPKRWGRTEREVPLYTIGVDAAKSLFLGRLAKTEKGPGYVHLPENEWCDAELAEQFTSEQLQRKFHKGLPRMVWVRVRPRNEGLDMTVYAIAALRLLNPKLNAMLETLCNAGAGSTRGPQGALPPSSQQRIPRRVSRSSYLSR